MPLLAAGGPLAVAGLVTGGFGAWAKANAAKLAQRRLLAAANMPGVDFSGTTGESLDAILGTMDKSAAVARGSTFADQQTFDQLLNAEIPGYRDIQDQRSRITRSALAGELDPSVVGQVNRRVASNALDRGFSPIGPQGRGGGQTMFDALSARDLGLTTRDLQNQGMGYAESLIRSTPISPLSRTASYLGPAPTQAVGIRENELARKQALLAEYAKMPGGTSVWGNYLSGIGGTLLGAGASMLGGGGGMGASGAQSYFGGGFGFDNPPPATDPGWTWDGARDWLLRGRKNPFAFGIE